MNPETISAHLSKKSTLKNLVEEYFDSGIISSNQISSFNNYLRQIHIEFPKEEDTNEVIPEDSPNLSDKMQSLNELTEKKFIRCLK